MLCEYTPDSYTELKRVNQEVLAEMQALREKSECDESRHLETIRQLTQEILEYKVNNTYHSLLTDKFEQKVLPLQILLLISPQEKHVELKHEIETYQGVLLF